MFPCDIRCVLCHCPVPQLYRDKTCLFLSLEREATLYFDTISSSRTGPWKGAGTPFIFWPRSSPLWHFSSFRSNNNRLKTNTKRRYQIEHYATISTTKQTNDSAAYSSDIGEGSFVCAKPHLTVHMVRCFWLFCEVDLGIVFQLYLLSKNIDCAYCLSLLFTSKSIGYSLYCALRS